MPRKRRPRLIAELARLVVEYPARDWKDLVDRLRDKEFMDDLAVAIEEAVRAAARSVDENTKKSESVYLKNALSTVEKQDPEKAQFLTMLKMRLSDKSEVVSLAQIREFAYSVGMKEELPSRRPQAINRIITYLAQKRTEEIEMALHKRIEHLEGKGHEYDQWVELILGHGTRSDRDEVAVPTDEDS